MKDGKERAGKRANPRRLAIEGFIRSILRTIKAKKDLPPHILEALLALDTQTIRKTRDLGKLGSLLGRALMWVITSELPTAASAAFALLNTFQKIATIHGSKSAMYDFDNEDTDEPPGPALALRSGPGFTLEPRNNGFSDDGDSTESPARPATESSRVAATEAPAGPATDSPSMDAAANLLGLSSSQSDFISQNLTSSQVGMYLDELP
jgi:hypothetical protein